MVGTPDPSPLSATDAPTGPHVAWTVREGDSLELLDTLDPQSIDAVVCDPPYGIDFCGQRWDGQVIRRHAARQDRHAKLTSNEAFQAWCRVWAQGCVAALKPGGHLAAFGSPRTSHRLACALEEAGFELRDTLLWLYGTGMPKSRHLSGGRATQLKPAYEPILLARRPLDGPVEHTLARYGTGALNAAACRTEDRFPANVLVSHHPDCTPQECVAQCAVRAVEEAAREVRAAGARPIRRLFYCPKASRSERDAGCEHLPRRRLDLFPSAQAGGPAPPPAANAHPTVKPLALMRWLIRLLTPANGLILDPFCGSGTTGCAAVLEQRRFLGIEVDSDYTQIARARIAHWQRTDPPRDVPTAPRQQDNDNEARDSSRPSDLTLGSEVPEAPPSALTSPPGQTDELALDGDSVERVARRVAELLAPRLSEPAAPGAGKLLSAAEVSQRWAVERSWVYEHAEELGAIRLGSGPKPRLRFPAEAIAHHLATLAADRHPGPRHDDARGSTRSPRIAADPVELLPIRRQSELTSSATTTDRPGGAPTPPATAPKTQPSAR